MWTLKVTSGPAQGQTLAVESPVIIGREDAELTIDDPQLSRRHVLVTPSEKGLVIEDLGSTNGTFVRGQRLSGPVELTAGDTIRIGSAEIAIEHELELGAHDVTRASPIFQAGDGPAEVPISETPPGRGERRRGRSPLVPIVAFALLAGVAAGAVLLLRGGDSTKTRKLEGVVFDAPIAGDVLDATLAGVVQGKPIGRMSVIIVRRLEIAPTPGGPAVPMTLKLEFSQPGGSFRGDLVGTVRVTEKGVEQAHGRATVSNGTGTYEGIQGSFTVSGNNPPSPVSRHTLQGTLEY